MFDPAPLLVRVCLLPLLGLALQAHAQDEAELKSAKTAEPDARLSAALDAAGIRYSVRASGDLQVTAALAGERSQSIILRSQTHAYRSEEWREVYSVAHRIDEDATLDAALAQRLLDANNTLVMGAWAMDRGKITLIVRLPARSSPLRLVEAIDFIAEVADGLEAELGSEDRF